MLPHSIDANNLVTDAPLLHLPEEMIDQITKHLDINDLASFLQANLQRKNFQTTWHYIAKKLNCPLDEDLPVARQVQTFIAQFKDKLRILDLLYEESLAEYTHSNNLWKLCEAQKALMERDIHTVCEIFERSIDKERSAEMKHLQQKHQARSKNFDITCQNHPRTSESFNIWCQARRTQLAAVTKLENLSRWITSLPPEIGHLVNLQELDFHMNLISALPPQIGNLAQLTKIDLSQNKLTVLPSEIGRLRQLQILNLFNNELDSLPSSIGNLSELRVLNLAKNELRSLPSSIGNLSLLNQLNLTENPLISLPKELNQLQGLAITGISVTLRTSLWANYFWTFVAGI